MNEESHQQPLRDAHASAGTFYVVGNGPSLSARVLETLPEGRWLGMNSAYRYWNQIRKYPKYYACLDPVVVKSHEAGILALMESSPIEKYFLHDSILEVAPQLADDPRVTLLSSFMARRDLTVPVSDASRHKQTTGSWSARFVIEQGERDLMLLGIDCNYIEVIDEAKKEGETELSIGRPVAKNPNYFFDGYQSVGDRYQVPNPRVHSGNLHLQSLICLRNDLLFSEHSVSVHVGSVRSLLHKYSVFSYRSYWHSLGRRSLQCVAVPLTKTEVGVFVDNMRKWLDPRLKPSLTPDIPGTCLHLFFAFAEDDEVIGLVNGFLSAHPEIRSYFDDVRLTFFGFPDEVNYYVRPGGNLTERFCTKSGPNLFFLCVMAQCREYEFTLQMESDCLPLRAGWLDAADGELRHGTEEAWIIGPGYLGPTPLHSSYRMHINGNAIYQTGSTQFQDFLSSSFATILKDLINLGINDLAYDTTLSLAYANLGLISESCKQALMQALPRFRHSNLILNAGGTRENAPGYEVDVRRMLAAHPETFLVHGRLAAEAVRENLSSLDRYFNTSPGNASKELPLVHLWSADSGIATLEHHGFGRANIRGTPSGAKCNVVLHFARVDGTTMSNKTITFSARARGSVARISALKVLLTGEGGAFRYLEGKSEITLDAQGADLSVVSPAFVVNESMSMVGVQLSIVGPAEDPAVDLVLSEILCQEKSEIPIDTRTATLVPQGPAILPIINSWRDFLVTGESSLGMPSGSTAFRFTLKNFESDEFLLDHLAVVGTAVEVRLKKIRIHAHATQLSGDRPAARLVFAGFPMGDASEIILSAKGIGTAGSVLCRICRDGNTPWEYGDISVGDDRPQKFANFFKAPHSGFRLEILRSAGLRDSQLISLRLELVLHEDTGNEDGTSSDAFPRLLVLDHTPIGGPSATGQIKQMFFEEWPADRLLQVYEDAKGLHAVRWRDNLRKEAILLDGDAIRACREFQPDVIYLRPTDSRSLLEFAENAVGQLSRPLVVHMMDDWPERLRIDDPKSFTRIDGLLRGLIDVATTRLSISKAMSDVYAGRYARPFLPLANGADVAAFPEKARGKLPGDDAGRPFLIRYMGGLAEDMTFASVMDVANAVSNLQARIPVRFEIYTMDWYLESASNAVAGLSGISVAPLVESGTYARHLAEADALLIAYNFDPASVRYVRLSVANKLPECLASGTPILAYGPKEVATIALIESYGCARLVDVRAQEELCSAIIELATRPDLRSRLGKIGRDIARRKHDRATVQRRFRELIRKSARTRLAIDMANAPPSATVLVSASPVTATSPRSRIVLGMDTSVVGAGWHDPEICEVGAFRWTGPETRSVLSLNVVRDRPMLAVVAYHTPLVDDQLRGVRMEIDGTEVPIVLRTDINPRSLLATVPARESTSDAATELALILPRTITPSSLSGNSADQRPLGLAVFWVSMIPLEPSLPARLPVSLLESIRRRVGLSRQNGILDHFPLSHFDGLSYLEANPDAAAAVIAGTISSALEHYLTQGRPNGRHFKLAAANAPSTGTFAELFDGSAYLMLHKDVAEAVRSGRYASAFDHYAESGRHERREIKTRFDGKTTRGTAADLIWLDAQNDMRAGMTALKASLSAEITASSDRLISQLANVQAEVPNLARVSEVEELKKEVLRAKLESDMGISRIATQQMDAERSRRSLAQEIGSQLDSLRRGAAELQSELKSVARADDLVAVRSELGGALSRVAAEGAADAARAMDELNALRTDFSSAMSNAATERAADMARARDELRALRSDVGSAMSQSAAESAADVARVRSEIASAVGGILERIGAEAADREARAQVFVQELERVAAKLSDAESALAQAARRDDLDSTKREALGELGRLRDTFAAALAQREAREQAMLQQVDPLRIGLQEAQSRVAVSARAEELERVRRDAAGDVDRLRRELMSNADVWRAREQAVLAQIDGLKAEVAAAQTRAELAEVKVASAQRELGAETWQIAGSLQQLATRLDSANGEVTKLQQEVGTVKGQAARIVHPSLNALNILGYQAHPRMLQKADAERLSKHWAPMLGLKVEENELYYLAHRICSIENACTGRLAASVNDMLLRILVARAVKSRSLTILEIGTLFGLGVGALHEALAPLFERVQFTVIDPLEGYYGAANRDILTGVPINRAVFEENLRRTGVGADRITLIQELSTEPRALQEAGKSQYDLLIIDADHSYAGVKNDTEKFVATARPGGYVIYDDYGNVHWPDVKKYVDAEVLPRKDLRFLGHDWHTAVLQVAASTA